MEQISKYKFDEYEADLQAGELRRNGQRLKLQLQPFYVLVALLERAKLVVTREDLRQRIWPEDTFVDFDHSLNTAVAKVRDALGDSANNPKYVETLAKKGYRFLRDVETVTESVPSTPAQGTFPQSASSSSRKESLSAARDVSGENEAQVNARNPDLPHASPAVTRLLFILVQVMYIIFYCSALLSWEKLAAAADSAWRGAGSAAFVVYMVTALVGLAVRLYLVTATAFNYQLLGEKYQRIFPAVFVLDMIWALSPLLLKDRMGMGLALGACAVLIYVPFAQRVLVKMMNQQA
jgi:DNA-binding winged helix-turn-helix (wHTH) protein